MLDNKDRQILAQLQRDGRMSVAELSDAVSLSDTPCSRRIKKLESNGVIEGYYAKVNAQKVGLGVQAYAFVKLSANSQHLAEHFEHAVAELANVTECAVVTGAHDYLLKIVASDLESYEKFVKQGLGSLNCIAGIETTIVLKHAFVHSHLPL